MIREAIILAGGLGTRLLPITKTIPKPLVPFQSGTVIDAILNLLKRQGILKATLCVGYIGEMIESYLGNGSRIGMKLTYSYDKELLGTGGALARVSAPSGTFLLLNADTFLECNLSKAYKQHKQSAALATILLTKVENPSEYGVVDLDGSFIKSFVMNPKPGEAPTNFVSSGYCIMEPSIFDHLPKGRFSLEHHVYPILATQKKLSSYVSKGVWFDVGTHKSLAQASILWGRKNTMQ
ncbi:MAG: nucleotidyltransferase family protein [Nanoarchaeota archaeon]